MELYRKTWTWNQWRTSPYILNDFSNWGFVKASDGSAIDISNLDSWDNYSGTSYGMNLKWKYDKLASNSYNTFTVGVDGTQIWTWGYTRGNFIGVRLNYSGGTKGSGFNLMLNGDSYYDQYAEVGNSSARNLKAFFIPLLNYGFLLNMRVNGPDQQESGDPDGASYAGQTPTLKTIYWNPGNNTTQGGNKTVIALPPTEKIGSLGYTYIVFQNNNGNTTINNVAKIWTDPNNVANLQYNEGIASIGYDNHTNITQDVCTLIRYPYQNTFLDNVYIMSTMPKQFDNDVAFFSLQNRNFMKVFQNIVVELPRS